MDTGYLIDKVVGSGTFGMVYLVIFYSLILRPKKRTQTKKLL